MPTRRDMLDTIARRLTMGTIPAKNAALVTLRDLLVSDLADAISDDEWGDLNASAELEEIALSVNDELSEALLTAEYSNDVEVTHRAANELLDQAMIHLDEIVDDAYDAIAYDEDVVKTQISQRSREV